MTISPEDLHVLRIYERLPPLSGGMEKHIEELSNAQRRSGVQVTNIFNIGSATDDSIKILDGIELTKLRPTVLRQLIFYSLAAIYSKQIKKDRKIIVVHAHGGWSAFLFAKILANTVNSKAIAATLHARIPSSPKLHKFALKYCDTFFATGLKEVEYLKSVSERKVTHLPSAPADAFFSKPKFVSEKTDVILVANFFPVKNIQLALRCAALRPNLRFSIYGDGPQRSQLEELIVALSITNVILHGSKSTLEIHSALHSAKVYLNVSLTEGSPTAALEAMACGIPIILTPSNDYSSLVENGISGVITSSWEIEEILSAIDACIVDDKYRRSMGDAAKTLAKNHSWDSKAKIVNQEMIEAILKNIKN